MMTGARNLLRLLLARVLAHPWRICRGLGTVILLMQRWKRLCVVILALRHEGAFCDGLALLPELVDLVAVQAPAASA